eukprot:SAG31_NODE_969_length_10677_cov_7.080072_5_plen_41_part_00
MHMCQDIVGEIDRLMQLDRRWLGRSGGAGGRDRGAVPKFR